LARVAAASLSSWSFDDSTGVPFPLSTVFHFLLPNENLFLVSAHLGEWPALGVSGKYGCGVVAPVGSHFESGVDGGILLEFFQIEPQMARNGHACNQHFGRYVPLGNLTGVNDGGPLAAGSSRNADSSFSEAVSGGRLGGVARARDLVDGR
jgi:hypothetical protein